MHDMYYRIYTISNNDKLYENIKILRFSYNPFYNSTTDRNILDTRTSNIFSFLMKLKEQAIKDKLCYNSIYPWDDIDEYKNNNTEVIIAYNCITNHIQGWCNLKYDVFNLNEEHRYYTIFIDKLVSRASPKIKYIGLLLLEFVRDILKTPIIYYDSDTRYVYKSTYIKINIDLMYLYSLTPSIDFYKKTFLTQLHSLNENENNILKHVFIYLNPEKIHDTSRSFKQQLLSLNILHTYESNPVILSSKSIEYYNSFKSNENCVNNNDNIDDFIESDFIDYNIDRIYGPRKTRSKLNKTSNLITSRTSKSSIKKK